MRLKMRVVQPVPYEPCHGRPDSQPARPRLPPGCGSRTQSSPSAGAPPPLHTPDLRNTCQHQMEFGSTYCNAPHLHEKGLRTHVGSRRQPSTFHKGRRGQVCSDRSPLWSPARTYGAAAGLGRVCQVAKPGRTGLLEGCHVGPTDQATMRRTPTTDV